MEQTPDDASSLKRGLLRKGTSTLIVKGIMFFCVTGAGVIIARALGPSGKGSYALATRLPLLIGTLGTWGINYALIHLLGKDTYKPQTVIAAALTWALLWGGALLLLTWLSFGYLQHTFLRGVDAGAFGLALAIIPFFLLLEVTSQSLRGLKEIDQFNLIWLVQATFRLLGLASALILLGGGAREAVAGSMISYVAATALSLWLLGRRVPLGLNRHLDLIKLFFARGLKTTLTQSMFTISSSIDILFLNYFGVATAEIGYYTLATSLAQVLGYIADSTVVVLLPSVASDAPAQKARITATAARYTLFITALGAVGMSICAAPLIVLVYGHDYLPTIWPLLLILPRVIGVTPYRVLGQVLIMERDPFYLAPVTGGTLVVSLILNGVLVPLFGTAGAAITSVVSFTLASVVTIYLFSRTMRVKASDTFLFSRKDCRSVLTSIRRQIKKLSILKRSESI